MSLLRILVPQSFGQARHTVKLFEMTRVSVHDSWGIFKGVRSCTLVTMENSVKRLCKVFCTYMGRPVLIPMTREGWTRCLKTRGHADHQSAACQSGISKTIRFYIPCTPALPRQQVHHMATLRDVIMLGPSTHMAREAQKLSGSSRSPP